MAGLAVGAAGLSEIALRPAAWVIKGSIAIVERQKLAPDTKFTLVFAHSAGINEFGVGDISIDSDLFDEVESVGVEGRRIYVLDSKRKKWIFDSDSGVSGRLCVGEEFPNTVRLIGARQFVALHQAKPSLPWERIGVITTLMVCILSIATYLLTKLRYAQT